MISFIGFVVFVALIALILFIYSNNVYTRVYHVLVVPAATNLKPMMAERPLIVLNQSDFSYSHDEKDVFVFRMADKSLKTEQDYERIVKNLLGDRNYKIYI